MPLSSHGHGMSHAVLCSVRFGWVGLFVLMLMFMLMFLFMFLYGNVYQCSTFERDV